VATLPAALVVEARIPVLHGIDRGAATVGQRVTVYGDWAATQDRQLTVLLDQGVAVAAQDLGDGSVSFVIPPLPNLGQPRQVPVKVRVAGQDSNTVTLEIANAAGRDGVGARTALAAIYGS
jgi:hypothetical protein